MSKNHISFGAVNCGPGEEWQRKAMWLGFGKEHPWFGGHNLQHWFEEDRTPKPACEMELWVQVLFICSQAACILSVIVIGLYVWAKKGNSVLAPGESLLGRILADWGMYCHYPMPKEVLICYCNTVWPMYVLDCEERWPMDGSLDSCTVMQLEQ